MPCVSATRAAGTMTKKPSETRKSPIANFSGPPSLTRIHSQAKRGAKAMTKSGCSDWNQLDGNDQPRIDVRVWRSAKSVSVEPDCSKAAKKISAKRKKTPMRKRRRLSSFGGGQAPSPVRTGGG